ncbi:hypothetical protein DITRI_Ditri18aG0101900 [Diplodiscus trichospermus]
MGCYCSKTKEGGPETPSKFKSDFQFEADLSSYEAACKHDQALKHFDVSLHERTNHVILMLSTGSDVGSLPFDALKEVIEYLFQTNQNVAQIVLERQDDIRKNKDLSSLVVEYFENSKKTLEFCAALENCLERAQNKQSIIQLAAEYFQEEVGLQVGTDEKKFVKTLEELRNFKAAEEPFTEEFFQLFDAVRQQQKSMLGKLLARKRKIDKKWKCLKTWKTVLNILFAATFFSVLIFSVVAVAIAAPPVVVALAGAMEVPIVSVGAWCNMLWTRYENELKGQEELINTLKDGARLTFEDMINIKALVSQLEDKMRPLSAAADFALGEEDEVKLAIDEIKKKLDVFVENVKELGQKAEMCSRDIKVASTVVFQKMTRKPSGTSTAGGSLWEVLLGL